MRRATFETGLNCGGALFSELETRELAGLCEPCYTELPAEKAAKYKESLKGKESPSVSV